MKGAAKEDANPIWATSNLSTKTEIAIPMVMARVKVSNIVGINGLASIFLVIYSAFKKLGRRPFFSRAVRATER